jgi:hypothetical protein
MIDSFPYSEWSEEIGAFWTFGPGGSAGTYTLTVLGIILMVLSFIGFVWLEHRKLANQATALRAAGLPLPAGPGTGASQPPLAGPTTQPGE